MKRSLFRSVCLLGEMIGSGAHDYTMGNWSTVLETVTDHIPVWASFNITRDDD